MVDVVGVVVWWGWCGGGGFVGGDWCGVVGGGWCGVVDVVGGGWWWLVLVW